MIKIEYTIDDNGEYLAHRHTLEKAFDAALKREAIGYCSSGILKVGAVEIYCIVTDLNKSLCVIKNICNQYQPERIISNFDEQEKRWTILDNVSSNEKLFSNIGALNKPIDLNYQGPLTND